ncbi:MAG: hypothetical protein DRP47_03565 [Candidatus Zixiibacteriota bacterium]|nr:MAG: hypothetical protein DRP47_03565 [candidate division Zixibacteria bacterium]
MIRPLVITILLIGLSLVIVAANDTSPNPGPGMELVALELIEQEYKDGHLTLDEKVRLQITAIKFPENLPDRFLPTPLSSSIMTGRCGSPVIDDIRSQWDALSTETKEYFQTAFLRAETEFKFLSPSGFFWMHYDTSGADSVPSADDDFNGVPDFVEKCAAYCDSALECHIDLGYLLPPSDGELGGDSLYDIYFEETGLYGYSMPEGLGPEPWNDYYSYIVINNDFLGFPPNNDPEGDQAGAAKVTCAHEFHHSCQYAYDVSEPTWIKEHDAVYFEDIVFDATDDNYQYLETFMQVPEKSLMDNGSHAYGSFIWAMFLAEKFDTSLMVAMWEGAIWDVAFDALADTINTRYGWTVDSAFAEFTVWNLCTDTRDDGLHYEESSQYPAVDIARSHASYPVELLTSPKNPAGYGSCYIDFFPGTATGILELSFNGDDNREWSAYVVKSLTENVHEFVKIELDPISMYGTIEIPLFETYYRVTLVGANLSEYSEGAFFSYSANVRLPYSVESEILTIDSSVYSGGIRDYEYRIINTSTLNDVYRITGWDAYGWIEPDSFDIAVLAGDDTIVTIPIHPAQGTPLNNLSSLTFKVWSRNDTTVVDSQFSGARTVLQHGDLDFDGIISVSDLTWLVAYLFTGGPEPVPISDAGDFTCEEDINVGDLTALVSYLFQGGNPPPCNPY